MTHISPQKKSSFFLDMSKHGEFFQKQNVRFYTLLEIDLNYFVILFILFIILRMKPQ